jgi:membrane protein
VVIRDLADGQLTLRAMSLVYTTLLSLVPLLAVSFSVLKGFGVHNKVEPMLLNLLAPLGEQGVEITTRIIEFVNNVKVGVLGSLGLLLLLYTVISLIQKIERTFNYTWNVSQSRSFIQRFSDYLSVIFVGPVFMFTAIGISASIFSAPIVKDIHEIEILGIIIDFLGRSVPYLLIILAFTFVYVLIPNTKVKVKSAFIGAVIAGILWESSGWIFASFLLNSTKYVAIYSAFASLIFFLIWLYLSWIILLIGASIAFYHQNPEYISREKVSLKISNGARELLTIQILLVISQRYNDIKNEISFDELVQLTSVPSIILSQTMDSLERGGFVIHTCEDIVRYFPARPLDKIKIIDVIRHVRSDGINYHIENNIQSDDTIVNDLFKTMDTAVDQSLRDTTFQKLVMELNTSKK